MTLTRILAEPWTDDDQRRLDSFLNEDTMTYVLLSDAGLVAGYACGTLPLAQPTHRWQLWAGELPELGQPLPCPGATETPPSSGRAAGHPSPSAGSVVAS